MAGRHVISRIEGINKERYESPTGPIQATGQLINLGLINGRYYIQVNGAGTIAESGGGGPSGD